MKKSPASQAIDSIIQESVSPLLKVEGFHKTARSFCRPQDDFIQVINFQSSVWNTPSSGQFTVNLNIVFPFYHQMLTNTPYPKNPGSAAPIFSRRIGLLMNERKDHWWVVTTDSDLSLIGREVAETMSTIGVPFLNEASSMDFLLTNLKMKNPPEGLAKAILLCYFDRKKEAEAIFRELETKCTMTGFKSTISKIKSNLGL
ncbi:DUF4304 domain-containing protein [Geomonas silvestris]|uniref:DUF4304 domain-containing protein n=1 Tax=Geomonas silvestris TaxID=2740184 RepID=UPI0016125B09|nr:DUF4304 domain-containing protein [Geomonas silvestris]